MTCRCVMNRKKIIGRLVLMALIASLLIITSVSADYSFSVTSAETVVEIDNDGLMTISLEYQFRNRGQKLDFIDIGLPNNNYSLGDIQVWLDDEVNSEIKVVRADYDQTGLRYGITLEMNGASIPSGGSGKINVWIPELKKNLYPATSETDGDVTLEFAGFNFSPNYFSSKFTEGKTRYSFIVVFPEGVFDNYVYYYTPTNWVGNDKPDAWLDENGRVVYEWYSEEADIHTEYTFGGKFLKDGLNSTDNIVTSSGGSSTSSGGGIDWWAVLGGLTCLAAPALVIFGIIKMVKGEQQAAKANARNYFPPQIKTDGEGIKRGLTAVEAAILLETDLEQVISMILYGLAKKEVVQVNSMEPLDVTIADPLPEDLNDYEKDFIEALKEPSKAAQKTKMRDAIHRLILSVSKKMEGFSLKETREYYQSICKKAWEQVEAADTPELKSKMLGDNFGWAMLQEEPDKKIEQTFSGYDVYPPYWWWRVDPGYRRPFYHSSPSSSSSSSSSESGGSSEKRSGSSSSGPSSMPVLPGAMFARSITQSAKKLGDSVTGNMNNFKSSIKGKTNPTPVYSSSSHRHGGGSSSGGSSCACACACDSCACACAGGGR